MKTRPTSVGLGIFASYLLMACEPLDQASNVKDVVVVTDPADIPDIVCDEGEVVHFRFLPLAQKPPVSATGLPHSMLYPSDDNLWYDPSKEQNLRLSGCFDEAVEPRIVLKQALILRGLTPYGQRTSFVTVDAAHGAVVKGLEKAVLSNDYSELDITIPYGAIRYSPDSTPAPMDGLLVVKGVPGANAAYAYEGETTAEGWRHYYPYIFVGELSYGDPLSDGRCDLDESSSTSLVRMGEASLRVAFCSSRLTTGTGKYRATSLSLVDPTRAIQLDLQGAAAVEEKLAIKINHHNGCDSFVLRHAGLVYAGTGAPSIGEDCSEILPDAPLRLEGDPHSLRYEITGPTGTESGFSRFCIYLGFCFGPN